MSHALRCWFGQSDLMCAETEGIYTHTIKLTKLGGADKRIDANIFEPL